MSYYLSGYQDYVPIGYHSKGDVLSLQQALNSYGAGLALDGIWGPKTNAAYNMYQNGVMGTNANGGLNSGSGAMGNGNFSFNSTDLNALYKQVLGILEPPSISYAMPSRNELYAQNAASMRPMYDNAIGARKKQTLANRAEIDVDAASRGMGRSTYVTDVKDRAMDAEATDIATLEGEYAAALAAAVQEQYDRHLANELMAKQYNAQMLSAAQNSAFSYATNMHMQNMALAREMEKEMAAAMKKAASSTKTKKTGGTDFSQEVLNAMNKTAKSLYENAETIEEVDKLIEDIKADKRYDAIYQKGSNDYIVGYLMGIK